MDHYEFEPGKLSDEETQKILSQRECGDCNLCCKYTGINELKKHRGIMCKNLIEHKCTIYQDRPKACSTFYCGWRLGMFAEDERPDKMGFLVAFKPVEEDPSQVWAMICVADREWQEPGRDLLPKLCRELYRNTKHVAVYDGKKVTLFQVDGSIIGGTAKSIPGEWEQQDITNVRPIGFIKVEEGAK